MPHKYESLINMFASLKNKIKEETGNDVQSVGVRRTSRFQRHRPDSLTSMTSLEEATILEQKDGEINSLQKQCQELQSELKDVQTQLTKLEEARTSLEETNKTLEQSLKIVQVQKDLIFDEQDKIQNLQTQEINKLKNLLMFREQETVDLISQHRTSQQEAENLRNELNRLKNMEPMVEDLQDELENLRHSSQMEKNNLTSSLAIKDEENRHLRSRIQVLEESRLVLNTSSTMDDKIHSLLQERKLLEQRLEEAHMHLSDIKSTWSGQNLALETQVSRLSRQVAEETTEKRKALQVRDELTEKVKQYEFDVEKTRSEISQRDNKIRLLSEEIDELSSALRELREEHEEEKIFLHSKIEQLEKEELILNGKLSEMETKLSDQSEHSEKMIHGYTNQVNMLENTISDLNDRLELEIQEKIILNAEISQKEEMLKQELRHEQNELAELQNEFDKSSNDLKDLKKENCDLKIFASEHKTNTFDFESLHQEIADKNKLIKILNQRLVDMKKTLQEEIKNSNNNNHNNNNNNNNCMNNVEKLIEKPSKEKKLSASSLYSNGNGPVIMDEVNFRYLKHVVLKFLTCRDVEAKHLIKAVSTLLQLSFDEEKLLNDTIVWKSSWFGIKPDIRLSKMPIPPS